MSPYDNFVLVKQVFEFAPVGPPPSALEGINHNLDRNYVFALHRAATVPKAFGRCSGVRCQAPEHFWSAWHGPRCIDLSGSVEPSCRKRE